MKRRKVLKSIELKIIAELMRNSRRSDRELARVIGTSQPTMSRLIKKLEKEGYIKEYTIIPDFKRLGYQIMGFTFFRLNAPNLEMQMELKEAAVKMDQENVFANMTVARGLGLGRNRVLTCFYKDYSDYTNVINRVKNLPHIDIDSLDNFLVDLQDDFSYRILSMKQVARNVESLAKTDAAKPQNEVPVRARHPKKM